MSVIGIFSVVLMGRFFGTLSTSLAACLLLAPLLAWIVELPRLRRLAPRWRNAWRLACVAAPLVIVVVRRRAQIHRRVDSPIQGAGAEAQFAVRSRNDRVGFRGPG